MSENIVNLSAYRDRRSALTAHTRLLALTVACPWEDCAAPVGSRCIVRGIDGEVVGELGDEHAAHWLRINAATRAAEQRGGHGA